RAAGDEGDLMPGTRQPCPVIPTHRTRADERDTHSHPMLMYATPSPGIRGPMSQLFRVKSLGRLTGDTEEPNHRLKRSLGPVQLTSLGIGAVIGAGLFSTVGTAAA